MLLASRTRRGPDRYLRWKAAALVVGALLVLTGARVGRPLLVWLGIAALAVGVVLRFLPQRPADAEAADPDVARDDDAT